MAVFRAGVSVKGRRPDVPFASRDAEVERVQGPRIPSVPAAGHWDAMTFEDPLHCPRESALGHVRVTAVHRVMRPTGLAKISFERDEPRPPHAD